MFTCQVKTLFNGCFFLISHSAEFAEASPDPKNTFKDMLKAEYVFVIPILKVEKSITIYQFSMSEDLKLWRLKTTVTVIFHRLGSV